VRERLHDLGPDVELALVTFSDPKYLRAYRGRTGWDEPILIDADRSVYRQFGYGRGAPWRVYGWRALRRYAQIFRGEGFGGYEKATEDTLQLGGNAVIDPDGATSWVFKGAGPDDRPSVDELIDRVEAARRRS
jgi:hypothetical protein